MVHDDVIIENACIVVSNINAATILIFQFKTVATFEALGVLARIEFPHELYSYIAL